jgi:hypothetical protein
MQHVSLQLDEWCAAIAPGEDLSSAARKELNEKGFVIIPGLIAAHELEKLTRAYDSVIASAAPPDLSHGSTTTRLHNLINRSPEFDQLFLYKPLLDACRETIRQPFKLSTLLARTVTAHAAAQELHSDTSDDERDSPMLGFIFMVDEFREDNGATRFVPGSHRISSNDRAESLATGPAGSMILHNGCVLHGHSANLSDKPRRSIQGAFVQRDADSSGTLTDWGDDTLARLSPLAKYLLAI